MSTKYIPKSDLEKIFFSGIENETPQRVKDNVLLDFSNKNEFTFTLRKEHLYRNSDDKRTLLEGEIRTPEGLGLLEWFANYEKEAMASTAGIRGLQNILYPWDTRYPLNFVGVTLATLGKILVIKEKYKDNIGKIFKFVSSEVRYNSDQYVELISRLQAAYGIRTYRTSNDNLLPIWMASFLIFTDDFYGGEYVTSSHALSKKIATKDLNFQGSQFIPEESILFINKVREILQTTERDGQFEIKFAAYDNPLIDYKYLPSINYGIPRYVEYLKTSVVQDQDINQILNMRKNIVIECMGGSMYKPLNEIFETLNISEKFNFINADFDPFFHGIGKQINSSGKFEDLGCDSSIVKINLETGDSDLLVVKTMNYAERLKDYPIGTVVLMTDPDGDRLVTAQIESSDKIDFLKEVGISHLDLGNNRILVVYTPNQSFLMNLVYRVDSLKKSGLWDKFNWFVVKTTPSAMSWDEWSGKNGIPVINTPVGFKEIATIMLKVEDKYNKFGGNNDIVITDVFGNDINLGKNPRLLFAGEESGGEIFGSHLLVTSRNGKSAISMREKSAGEAIFITSAMSALLESNNMFFSDYLKQIFDNWDIKGRYDIRIDKKYYNESEADIAKLLEDKKTGIQIRTNNDMFFLSIAIAYTDHQISLEDVKAILKEGFSKLSFDDLIDIKFVGDGTYLRFEDKYVEVRPSGTDAINKAYSSGNKFEECVKFAQEFASFPGERSPLHIKLISEELYSCIKDESLKRLISYQQKDAPKVEFGPPELVPV